MDAAGVAWNLILLFLFAVLYSGSAASAMLKVDPA